MGPTYLVMLIAGEAAVILHSRTNRGDAEELLEEAVEEQRKLGHVGKGHVALVTVDRKVQL